MAKTGEKYYNPNRFNAFDGALSYLAVLIAFVGVPYAVTKFAKPFLRAIYNYDTYAYLSVNLIISQSIIFVIAIIWCIIRKSNPFEGGGYTFKWDGVQILMSFVLIMGVMMTFYYSHLRFGEDAEAILGESGLHIVESREFIVYFFLYLVLVSVAPAIVEEMLFRGIIMRGFEEFGRVAAVVCSAAAFSLMHGNFSQVILQFIGGLAIGSVVMITGNWFLGSAMHFFNNAFSMVFGVLISDELVTDALGLYLNAVVDAACILIGVACLTIAVVYFGKLAFVNLSSPKNNHGNPFEKKKYYAERNDAGEITLTEASVKAPLQERGKEERYFFIRGKYRKLNGKAPFVPTVILLCAAYIAATVMLFAGL